MLPDRNPEHHEAMSFVLRRRIASKHGARHIPHRIKSHVKPDLQPTPCTRPDSSSCWDSSMSLRSVYVHREELHVSNLLRRVIHTRNNDRNVPMPQRHLDKPRKQMANHPRIIISLTPINPINHNKKSRHLRRKLLKDPKQLRESRRPLLQPPRITQLRPTIRQFRPQVQQLPQQPFHKPHHRRPMMILPFRHITKRKKHRHPPRLQRPYNIHRRLRNPTVLIP